MLLFLAGENDSKPYENDGDRVLVTSGVFSLMQLMFGKYLQKPIDGEQQ